MSRQLRLLVYPTKDLARAKALLQELLGAEPYADMPYYVGFRTEDVEIGLDPRGKSQGPIAYWEVDDIQAGLKQLLDAGAQADHDVHDVGGGKLVATVKDADGSSLGLMQSP